MADFLVRIELHDDPTWDDYLTLHEKMEAQGFHRTITAESGVTYHLPDAEYELQGDFERKDVLAKAKSAASQVKKKYGALVTKANGQTWDGLEKV